ncbi:hypothetical protein Pint_27846 [Pistacia integerrima]|uniref:Uncharacterized protein n=1 Tax=Pistacia integerrima TaxID=434235 RepID=A0ACC0YVI4_9ROSI|nr:hypothetical protein Pint_27846 [Pistacia integerrima]
MQKFDLGPIQLGLNTNHQTQSSPLLPRVPPHKNRHFVSSLLLLFLDLIQKNRNSKAMASVFAGALQSTRPLSFASLPSPKFTSHSLSNWCLKSRPRTIATNFSFKSRNSALSGSRFLVRANAEEFSPDVGEVLGDVSIFTAAGEPVLFKDLWDQTEGVAVVALLRHFGCPCCWELASALKEAKATFDSAGVKLIAVGVGTPNKAQILAQQVFFHFYHAHCMKDIHMFVSLCVHMQGADRFLSHVVLVQLPFPMDCLYADPDCKAYNLLGLYYGIGRTFFNPKSVKVLSRFGALQKAVKNYTIEATPDDKRGVLQQGGMFVFKGKDLLYAWRDEGTGDHAPFDDIFSICCRVPA